MKKQIVSVYVGLFSLVAAGQVPDTITEKLSKLEEPTKFGYNYVNFDFFKIKFGHGLSTYKTEYRPSLSIEFQILWPVALMKDVWPIAFGLTFGATKISMQHSELIFSGPRLVEIKNNPDIEKSVQRTGYIGPVIFPLIKQFKRAGITFLAGASVNYNMVGRLRVNTDTEKLRILSGKNINRFSIPIHVQVSKSRRQFISLGIHGSYDLIPRFRGEQYNEIKQVVVGLSVAVIL